ncbi:MAG TPA: CerR family C-terminal domain-containing protein [Pirellulales bacterium]|nr:CerR family C-terminal domain-containing protein [Pirellulales bacterium]
MTGGIDETKERLLEAAGMVFSERGFRAATVREICQRAGANLAAVNYYFGDKERLYVESVKRAHARREEAAPLPYWPSDTPPEVKLHGFVQTLLSRMLGDPRSAWQAQLMFREMQQPTAACGELVEEYIRPHFELLQSIIADLAPAGISEQQRRLIAFGIVGQCLYFRIAEPVVRQLLDQTEFAHVEPGRLADHITHWTLAALGRRQFVSPDGVAGRKRQETGR